MQLIERIFFPTDFGKSAEIALESVISIAKKFGSEVIVAHVLPDNLISDKVQAFVSEKMDKFVGLLEEQEIKCSSELLYGSHIDDLVPFAERRKANLIVLGASGAKKEKFAWEVIRENYQKIFDSCMGN